MAVRLPAALETRSTQEQTHVVFHEASDGLRLSTGDGLYYDETTGTDVVTAQSLSSFSAAVFACTMPFAQALCLPALDELYSDMLVQAAHRGVPMPGTNTPQPCFTDNARALSSGNFSWGLYCVNVAVSGDKARYTFENTTSVSVPGSLGFASGTGAAFGFEADNGLAPYELSLNASNPYGVLSQAWALSMGRSGQFVPPGYSVIFTKTEGDPATKVAASASPAATMKIFLMLQTVTILDSVASHYLGIFQLAKMGVPTCAQMGTMTDADVASGYECMAGFVSDAAGSIEASMKAAGASDQALAPIRSVQKWAGAIGEARLIADAIYTVGVLVFNISPGTVALEYRALPPTPPVSSLGGIAGDGKYVARTNDGRAFLVSVNGGALSITTNGDFNCYVTGYFVMDQISTHFAGENEHLEVPNDPMVVGNAPACTQMDPVWDYGPSGNIPRGVLVRQPDWETNWAAYINAEGEMQWLSEWQPYAAMTQTMPAIYNFPASEVDYWPKGNDIDSWPTS